MPLGGVNNHKEGVNINKDVLLFGYSAGNDYLCKDFSAKAIKDIFSSLCSMILAEVNENN